VRGAVLDEDVRGLFSGARREEEGEGEEEEEEEEEEECLGRERVKKEKSESSKKDISLLEGFTFSPEEIEAKKRVGEKKTRHVVHSILDAPGEYRERRTDHVLRAFPQGEVQESDARGGK